MDPAIVLLWMQMITEFAAAGEGLYAIGRRILAGENITREELVAKRNETDVAVLRWDAAAPDDQGAPQKEDAGGDDSDVPGPSPAG